VDLVHGWRSVPQSNGLPPALYLFSGNDAAESFLKGLPQSQIAADSAWASWFGQHGFSAPYAMSGGPFNSACYTNGGPNPGQDCAVNPQKVLK
jgi:hypothetical protein